jgi:hypothetical protein
MDIAKLIKQLEQFLIKEKPFIKIHIHLMRGNKNGTGDTIRFFNSNGEKKKNPTDK